MEKNIFPEEYFKIIKYLYKLKNTLNISVALIGYNRGNNGMSEESIKNITKSDSNFTPIFVDHHLLPDMNTV